MTRSRVDMSTTLGGAATSASLRKSGTVQSVSSSSGFPEGVSAGSEGVGEDARITCGSPVLKKRFCLKRNWSPSSSTVITGKPTCQADCEHVSAEQGERLRTFSTQQSIICSTSMPDAADSARHKSLLVSHACLCSLR